MKKTISMLEENKENRYKERVNQFTKTAIGKPETWLIEAASSVGLDYSELTHEVTAFFLQHVVRRHSKGHLAIGERDYKKIPGILKAPDLAIIGASRGNKLFNVYAKRIEGETYLYFEDVLNSNRNKALRGSTFYKIKKELDIDNLVRIITMNGKSDISRAKKL